MNSLWGYMKCRAKAASKTIEMTEWGCCQPGQSSKVPLQLWNIFFSLLPKISDRLFHESAILKHCLLVLVKFSTQLLCILFVQFGQYTVSSWSKGSLLPRSSLPYRSKCHMELFHCLSYSLKKKRGTAKRWHVSLSTVLSFRNVSISCCLYIVSFFL